MKCSDAFVMLVRNLAQFGFNGVNELDWNFDEFWQMPTLSNKLRILSLVTCHLKQPCFYLMGGLPSAILYISI